jgi:hypothetical protein
LCYLSELLGVQILKFRSFSCYEFGRWLWSLFSILLFCHCSIYVSSHYSMCNIKLGSNSCILFSIVKLWYLLNWSLINDIHIPFGYLWCFDFHYEWSNKCYAYYRWIVWHWHPRWRIELLLVCMINIALYMFYGNMVLHQTLQVLWNKLIS